MATAARVRRRAEVEQEVQRKLLAARDHKRIEGAGDARFHVVVEMLLDMQDDVDELRLEVRNHYLSGGD